MIKLLIKSLIFGFITGTVFLVVVPFGLISAFIEFLRPILIPGIDLLIIPLWQNPSGFSPWVMGFILNGLIYTVFFFAILFILKYAIGGMIKFLLISSVILAFLAATGMLSRLYYFLISPDKSWIFRIGA